MDVLDQIFKAYDIRGRVDTGELDEGIARSVGAGFASMIDESAVAVGRDCRASSPGLAAAFIEGVIASGKDVIDVGEVSTDVIIAPATERAPATK